MSHAKHPAAALALLGLIACDPVKASLESGLISDTNGGPHTGDTGSIDSAEIGDTARTGPPACALVDGALANCTLGEMVQAMADVYGRYTGGPEW